MVYHESRMVMQSEVGGILKGETKFLNLLLIKPAFGKLFIDIK